MFDPKRKIVGLMPSDRRRKHAFPLRKKDRKVSGGRCINAMYFCKHRGIRPSETFAFSNPEVNKDGILVLSLHELRSVKKV